MHPFDMSLVYNFYWAVLFFLVNEKMRVFTAESKHEAEEVLFGIIKVEQLKPAGSRQLFSVQ
jgi:hypothetical protein